MIKGVKGKILDGFDTELKDIARETVYNNGR